MSKDDYIHIDQAVEVVIENGWLRPSDIASYIEDSCNENPEDGKMFYIELKKLLKKKGFKFGKIPENPSKRE